MNKSEYVNTMTQAYELNAEAEIILHTATNKEFQSLFDTDMNNQLDVGEYVRKFKVFGHNNDSSDMAAFRIAYNNTERVPSKVAMKSWIRFVTDTSTSATNDTIDEAIKTALHEEL